MVCLGWLVEVVCSVAGVVVPDSVTGSAEHEHVGVRVVPFAARLFPAFDVMDLDLPGTPAASLALVAAPFPDFPQDSLGSGSAPATSTALPVPMSCPGVDFAVALSPLGSPHLGQSRDFPVVTSLALDCCSILAPSAGASVVTWVVCHVLILHAFP